MATEDRDKCCTQQNNEYNENNYLKNKTTMIKSK